jgi:DNA-binding beta-propeller fold protein YncE
MRSVEQARCRFLTGSIVFRVLAILLWIAGDALAQHLLVANRSDDNLSVISIADGREIARVDTGHSPHEVEIDASGTVAIVSNYGTNDEPGSTLTRIDLETLAVSTLDVGPDTRPHGLAWLPDGRHALVTTEGTQAIALVDLETMSVTTSIPTPGKQPHMVVVDSAGRWAWVTHVVSGDVSKIDLVALEVVASVPAGEGAEGIAVDSEGRLWTAANGDGTVRVFDADSLEQLAAIDVGGMAIRVELAEEHGIALVTSAVAGRITAIDMNTVEIRRDVSTRWHTRLSSGRFLGGFFGALPVPVGAQLGPTGNSFYVANSFGGVVVEFSLPCFEVLREFEAGREPDGMAVVVKSKGH